MTSMGYAVIDADFFIKMTQYAQDDGKLFLQLMHDLWVQPVTHKYVIDVELKDIPCIRKLKDTGCIEIRDYEDYLTSDKSKEDYENYFLTAFEKMNLYAFPMGEDIYTYHCTDESLGEIRSLYMAKELGYEYFMSDDGGARRLAESLVNGPAAWNLYQALVKCKEMGTSITYRQLNPTVTNVFRERRNMLKHLQELYAKDKL